MTDTTRNRFSNPSTHWLALVAAAGLAAAFLARMRRGKTAIASTESVLNIQTDPDIRQQAAPSQTTLNRIPRLLRFLAVSIMLAVLLVISEGVVPGAGGIVFAVVIGMGIVAVACSWPPTQRLLRWTAQVPVGLTRWLFHRIQKLLVHYQRQVYVLSLSGAVAMLTFAAWSFQTTRDFLLPLDEPLFFTLSGALALGLAVALNRPNLPLPLLPALVLRANPARANRPLAGAGLLVLLLLAEINGDMLHITALRFVSTNVQFILLVLGVALVALGVGGLFMPRNLEVRRTGFMVRDIPPRSSRNFIARRPRFAVALALLALMLLAAFCRFWQLDNAMRFLVDEESFVGATQFLRNTPSMALLQPFSSIAAFPYLFPYGQLKTIELFGQNLVGLRAFGAALGVLYVPALYFLARTLFDRKTALLAALCIAVFPPHIQFSRIGISEIAAPLFGVLSFAFLGRGMLRGGRMDYAVGGALLGMTHYFHEGGRLLFTPLAAAWVIGCLLAGRRESSFPHESPVLSDAHGLEAETQSSDVSRQRFAQRIWNPEFRLHLRRALIAVVVLVIVAAPIYYTLIGIDRPLFARMVDNNSGLSGDYWRTLFDGNNFRAHLENHVLAGFMVYVQQVDNTLFYAGNLGLIIPAVIPFFLLGVFYALWRWRAPGLMLLLGWIFTTSFGNSFMVDSAGSPRYAMVFPALALAIAVGVRYGGAMLWRDERRNGLLLVIVGLLLAVAQVSYYFNDHLPLYNEQFRAENASPDGYDAALRSLSFPAGTHIHIVSLHLVNQIEANGLLGLHRNDLYLETLTTRQFTPFYIDRLRCRVDHAFFVERNDFETINNLRARFYLRPPEFTPFTDLPPIQQLVLFYAPYMRGSEVIYGREC